MIVLLFAFAAFARADLSEAALEYRHARQLWVTSSLRSFVYRDVTGKSWAGGVSLHGTDEWDDPNPFEREIEAAAEKIIRLELEMCARYNLSPHQVWQPLTHVGGVGQARLGPRAAPFSAEYVPELVAGVERISPNFAALLRRWDVERWPTRSLEQEPGETIADWRYRVWSDSQLYDHATQDDFEDQSWIQRFWLGPDPTEKMLKLERTLQTRYSMSDEDLWEAVHYVLNPWREDAWSSLHQPRRRPPPVPSFEHDLVSGVGKIHRLAGQRLRGRLEDQRGILKRYRLDEHVPPDVAEAAARALDADPRRGEMPGYVREQFNRIMAASRARQNPYVPGDVDPKIAEELGRRLLEARARGLARCGDQLERP